MVDTRTIVEAGALVIALIGVVFTILSPAFIITKLLDITAEISALSEQHESFNSRFDSMENTVETKMDEIGGRVDENVGRLELQQKQIHNMLVQQDGNDHTGRMADGGNEVVCDDPDCPICGGRVKKQQ